MYSGVGNDDQHELLEEDEEEEDDDNDKRTILDQERFLPIANISRIMKKLLPTSGKVAKEAKECVQECVSEFISFLTSEACDRCRQEKRKTISAEDLMRSLMNMGFDEYIEPMESFLRRYREVNKIAHRPPMYQPGTGSYGNPALASNAVITQPIALTIPHSAPMVSTSSAPIQFATASHVQLATPQIQAAPRIAPQPGVQVYTQ